MQAFDLSGRVAVVTGGNGGIGLGMAEGLAQAGASVMIAGRDRDKSQRAVEQLERSGARSSSAQVDVSNKDSIERMFDATVERFGRVDILVTNAGTNIRKPPQDYTLEEWTEVLDINLRGTFFFTQAIARHMASTPCEHPRAIVTVSSVSVEMASIERGEYCISKSALGMLTRLFALRLAPLGIGVFEIRPGIIRTPMTDAVSTKYDERIAGGLVPSGRWGQPEDVARCVAAVASGRLAFATGSVLHVDGALSIPRL